MFAQHQFDMEHIEGQNIVMITKDMNTIYSRTVFEFDDLISGKYANKCTELQGLLISECIKTKVEYKHNENIRGWRYGAII